MLFSVGTRVKFLHSKDEGVVTALLGDDMVQVLLDEDDMEIPAYIGDLVRMEDYLQQQAAEAARKQTFNKSTTTNQANSGSTKFSANTAVSLGIQLAFDPVFRPDGSTEKFDLYLINDTSFDFLYDIELSLKQAVADVFNGKLDAVSYLSLGDFLYDELNEAPLFDCHFHQLTTAGKGPAVKKQLKIKAKQFFKNQRRAPLLNRPVHHYILFDQFEKKKEKKPKEDLKSYTQRNARPIRRKPNNLSYYNGPDIREFAEFSHELDLHIEKIAPDLGKRSNREIIQIQLAHFDQFISKAIRLGVKRVFVIHGVGKGKLRDSIASRLIQMPEVTTFKNEYHPKYGYGATEVFLEV